MPSSNAYAVVLVLLALPLFAWPLASPPPDPPDKLAYDAHRVAAADQFPDDELDYRYEALSERGQQVVREAVESGEARRGSYTVAASTGAPEFESRGEGLAYVQYDGSVYMVDVDYRDTPPSGAAVVTRFGALLTSLALVPFAGYLYVNR